MLINSLARASPHQAWRGYAHYGSRTIHSDTDCHIQHKQYKGNANTASVQSLRVGMCSAVDLSEQDNETERPYVAFLVTEATSRAALHRWRRVRGNSALCEPFVQRLVLGHLSSDAGQLSLGTLSTITPCSATDSGLSSNLWGKRMLIAAYLCNQLPHLTLQ